MLGHKGCLYSHIEFLLRAVGQTDCFLPRFLHSVGADPSIGAQVHKQSTPQSPTKDVAERRLVVITVQRCDHRAQLDGLATADLPGGNRRRGGKYAGNPHHDFEPQGAERSPGS